MIVESCEFPGHHTGRLKRIQGTISHKKAICCEGHLRYVCWPFIILEEL